MSHPILGLDLGSRRVKAVVLETTLRGFTVTGAAEIAVPAEAEGSPSAVDRVSAALRDLLAERRWPADAAAVASLPGMAAASHLVTLPFSDARRIEQTVQYEVEAAIPFDLDQVAWDWQPLDTQPGRSDLFIGVARRDELGALVASLAAVGVDPAVVMPGGPALAALWAAGAVADPAAAADAELVVDVGAERTHVCAVSEGRCLFARTFGSGSTSVLRGAARSAGMNPDALEPVEGLPAWLAGADGEARLRSGLAPLVRELRATLRAFEARPSRRPVVRIRLAGGLAGWPGVASFVGEELAIPAEPLRLAGPAADVIGPEDAPRFALALALALRGWLGNRFQRLNLRRGALASTRSTQNVRDRLQRIAVYASLVLLLGVVSSAVKVVALNRQEKLLDQAMCDVTQKVVGKCFDDFAMAESVLRGRGSAGSAIPRISAAGVLAELASRTPAVQLRFDRIEISREKLHLQGTTDAAENVDKIVAALRGSRCFPDARSGGARKRGTEQKFEFTVDSDITCEGAVAAPGGKG
jgi:general secretion pathway protein L